MPTSATHSHEPQRQPTAYRILLAPPPAAVDQGQQSTRDPGGQEVFGAKAHERTRTHTTNELDCLDTRRVNVYIAYADDNI